MFVFVDDIKLPAKTEIHILINVLHRDPKYFPDPDRFDPNRFLENDMKHPFAFVPFSAGQRNCIGIELQQKYISATIIHFIWLGQVHLCLMFFRSKIRDDGVANRNRRDYKKF